MGNPPYQIFGFDGSILLAYGGFVNFITFRVRGDKCQEKNPASSSTDD
jgi:hypothetical protein